MSLEFHKFPSIDSLERVIHNIVGKNVLVTEKLHGTSFRFQLTHTVQHLVECNCVETYSQYRVKFGTRNLELDTNKELKGEGVSFFGGRPVRTILTRVNMGDFDRAWDKLGLTYDIKITVYGEWAGRGVMGGIDYGEPDFYCYRVLAGKRILSRAEMVSFCDLTMTSYVPEYASGTFSYEQFNEMLTKPSIIANGGLIEGIVIMVDPPQVNEFGELLIAKHKNEKFKEVGAKKPRDPMRRVTQSVAIEFADRYVNRARLDNILSHADFVPDNSMKDMSHLIKLIPSDIIKEGKEDWDEAIADGATERQLILAITAKTAKLYKEILVERAKNV